MVAGGSGRVCEKLKQPCLHMDCEPMKSAISRDAAAWQEVVSDLRPLLDQVNPGF